MGGVRVLRDPGRTGEAFPCHFPSATSAWITTAARCDVCADRPGQPPEQPFAVANDGAGVAELTARLRRAGAREAALERGDGPAGGRAHGGRGHAGYLDPAKPPTGLRFDLGLT